MQALQWALDQPGEVERAVLICASARLSAQNIGFSKAARAAIRRDGHDGMAFARMLAHITYLSEHGMELKFGRARRADGPMTMDSDFEVEHYLDHQAEIFLARFDPADLPLPVAGHGLLRPVRGAGRSGRTRASWRCRSTATGASGREHSRHITRELEALGADVRHDEVESPWGHDSFLMDVPGYQELVAAFLA